MKKITTYMNGTDREMTCGKHKIPYVMSKEELVNTLVASNDIRLSMVMFVGVFQGLRIGEIIRLKWEHIDLFHGEIRVLDAKNTKRYKSGYGRDRIVPINEMFIEVYQRWRNMNPKEEYFLPRDHRYHGKEKDTSVIRNYQKRFHDALEKVDLKHIDYYQKNGIPRYKYHLHTLRHVCGTNLYRAGLDLYKIKEYLGHEDIETTQIYCDLAKDDLRKASEMAYAYPQSLRSAPQQEAVITIDSSESLKLQKEVLEKQIELLKMKSQIEQIAMVR